MPTIRNEPDLQNARNARRSTASLFVVESHREKTCAARQHSAHATDGSTCVRSQPIFTGLLRPATAFRGGVQSYCGLLHGKALASRASARSIGPALETFQARLQAASGAAAKANRRVEHVDET
ncbi:hypothetical protein DPSP01_009383 [Paraphaeosphaeria sporulosa]